MFHQWCLLKGNSLSEQCTQDSLGEEEDSVPQILLLCCDWTLCMCSHVSTCAFAVSALLQRRQTMPWRWTQAANRDPGRCHSIREWGAAHTSVQCCAPVLFSHVQRLTVSRLAEQKSHSWRASLMNRERSYTRKCKGPNTKTILAKTEIWNLEMLESLPRPLKSESNRKKCILMLPSLHFRMS